MNNQTLKYIQTIKDFYYLKQASFMSLNEKDKKGVFDECVSSTLALSGNTRIRDYSFLESIFLEKLNYVKQNLSHMKKTLKIKVSLRNHEDHIFRVIELPYHIALADMCYMVLSSLHACRRNQFIIAVHKKQYRSDTCQDSQLGDYASLVDLADLSLSKNDHMRLTYDMKQKYIIDIEVIDIVEHKQIQSLNNAHILLGKGYGIWEDAHALLDAYYLNPDEFQTMIQGLNLDDLDFYIDDFDQEVAFLKKSEELKMMYEM